MNEFKFNKTKGFFCLSHPVPFCLAASKGRTRGTNTPSMKPDELVPRKMKIIRHSYRAEMKNLFHLIYPELEEKVFCKEPGLHRFAWLQRFLCSGEEI